MKITIETDGLTALNTKVYAEEDQGEKSQIGGIMCLTIDSSEGFEAEVVRFARDSKGKPIVDGDHCREEALPLLDHCQQFMSGAYKMPQGN